MCTPSLVPRRTRYLCRYDRKSFIKFDAKIVMVNTSDKPKDIQKLEYKDIKIVRILAIQY